MTTERAQYWNEQYLQYWEAKVAEANTVEKATINKEDCKTGSDAVAYGLFSLAKMKENDIVLDFGCGFCRFYPYFKERNLRYYGIDISKEMIEKSKLLYPEISDFLRVAEGEKLPFGREFFDIIICYGVFDACYQEEALVEMLKAVKKDGRIVFSGKNTTYFSNDEKAIVAEVNAREKGHPNYFTDVKKMKEQLLDKCCVFEEERYFLYRGDATNGKFTNTMPENFYEWQFIIQKKSKNITPFLKFSDKFSDKFKVL